jgi:hypothetical protein
MNTATTAAGGGRPRLSAAGRGIHVDEVEFHVVLLAIDFVFADMVEMELDQRQRCSVDGDAAAGLVVDLDGVAIVDDLQRRKFVIKLYGSQLGRLSADDIDGGLALAGLTSGEIGLKVAPVLGAFRSAVTPVRSIGLVLLRDCGMRETERDAENERRCCDAGQTSRHCGISFLKGKRSISLCRRIFKYSVWKFRIVRVYSQGLSGSEGENMRNVFEDGRANKPPGRSGKI